jgi:hypothetical protein
VCRDRRARAAKAGRLGRLPSRTKGKPLDGLRCPFLGDRRPTGGSPPGSSYSAKPRSVAAVCRPQARVVTPIPDSIGIERFTGSHLGRCSPGGWCASMTIAFPPDSTVWRARRIAAASRPPSMRKRTRTSAPLKKILAPLSGRATHGVLEAPSKEITHARVTAPRV